VLNEAAGMSWAVREPDEPLEDWLLRLAISYRAIRDHEITLPELESA
jgi:hypothetical protein